MKTISIQSTIKCAALATGLGALAFAALPSATAQHKSPAGLRAPKVLGQFQPELSRLTPEQREQLKAVAQDHQATVEPLIRAFIAQRRSLQDTIAQGPRSTPAIMAEVEALGAVKADLAVAMAYAVNDARALLTEDQKAAADAMGDRLYERVDTVIATDWTEPGALEAAVPKRVLDRVRHKLAGLELTDSQREQIKGLLKNHSASVKPLVEEVVAESRAVRELVRADEVDEQAIRDAVAEVTATQKNLAAKRAVLQAQVVDQLSDEQLAKVQTFRENVRARVDLIVDFVSDWIAG